MLPCGNKKVERARADVNYCKPEYGSKLVCDTLYRCHAMTVVKPEVLGGHLAPGYRHHTPRSGRSDGRLTHSQVLSHNYSDCDRFLK